MANHPSNTRAVLALFVGFLGGVILTLLVSRQDVRTQDTVTFTGRNLKKVVAITEDRGTSQINTKTDPALAVEGEANGEPRKLFWGSIKSAFSSAGNSISSELNSWKNKASDLANQVSSLKNEVSNLSGRIRDLSSDVANKANKITEITNLANSLKNEVTDKANQINNLAHKVSSLTTDVANKANVITDLTNSVNWLKNEVSNKANQITNLANLVTSLKAEITHKVNQVTDLTNKVGSLTGDLATKTFKITELTDAMTWLKNDLTDKANQVSSLTNTVTSLKNEITSKASQITNDSLKLASDATKILNLEAKIKSLYEEIGSWKHKINSLPSVLEDKIVKPIEDDINKMFNDIKKIDSIADEVADATVKVIKQLDFLPKTGAELGSLLAGQFRNFIGGDFCVPYSCLANQLELDINDIVLYKSQRLSVSTALTPKTCFEVTSIEFDSSKLGNFLDLFRDLKVLKDIFDKVSAYLKKEMSKILEITDELEELLDDIKDLAEDAIDAIGFRARRQLLVIAEDGKPVTMEEVAAIAHEKGMEKFKELYGEHIQQVFHERKLAENGAEYIGFQSLQLTLSVNFGQTVNLEASNRAGYSGSIFDESMHQTKVIPVPFTAGMVNIVASASMEASMPYAMAIEGEANAKFGYSVGNTAVTVDLISGQVETRKDPFETKFEMDATVEVSGTMSLNFAASASLGICLGPSENACITVAFDAKQTSAAGFDTVGGINSNQTLTALYTDVLEYKTQPESCDGDLTLDAGYWQYVEEPSIVVSITTSAACKDKSDILYQRKGRLLQKSIDSFCLATNVDIL